MARGEEERRKIPFRVPFISDEVSAENCVCGGKADLRQVVKVVEVQVTNLGRSWSG